MLLMHAESPMARRTTKAMVALAFGLGWFAGTTVPIRGQESAAPPAEQPQAEQDLTAGLLELLTEPVAEPAGPPAAAAGEAGAVPTPPAPGTVPSTSQNGPVTTLPMETPRGLGSSDRGAGEVDAGDLADGEDLGAGRGNPLAEVRLGMLTAAGWLRERSDVAKTEALQRDIVARLDQLISDLNQQTPQPAPPTDSQTSPPLQPPQRSTAQDAAGEQSESAEGTRQQQTSREAATAQESSADAAGTQGEPTPGGRERQRVVVDLNDPTALQRSVWGNLPDRVREQMQSRMVERFLPDYREAIEAYYRALSR